MGLFSSQEDFERKKKLKALEDKRMAFALQLARDGFTPERMLFSQMDNGGFAAICRFKGRFCLIVSPGFGTDESFTLEYFDKPDYTRQKVLVKGEGMGGIFGFGKKGEEGVEYIIRRADGSEVHMPFVAGRNCWLETTLAKNPLLKTKRRRGDANLVWDFKPLDLSSVAYASKVAESCFEGE